MLAIMSTASDEAHRTQLGAFSKSSSAKMPMRIMKAMVSKPYAKVLKEALPHATFVGFMAQPIGRRVSDFGDVDQLPWLMDQAVADNRRYPSSITQECAFAGYREGQGNRNYYKTCADDGATKEDMRSQQKR